MGARRIVPNIATSQPDMCRAFYADFLGMQVAMDMGWIVTYVSPTNPTAQISLVRNAAPPVPAHLVSITIEVDDVAALHAAALTRNYLIVYPLTDEAWGVRRFGVADPNGVFINVMCHIPPPAGVTTSG